MQIYPLFSDPIFIDQIEPVSENIKKFIINNKFQCDENSLFLSNDDYILNHANLLWLKNQIICSFNRYVYDILKVSSSVKFKLTNSWIVKTEINGETRTHFHGNSLVSGVYYLKSPINCGNIRFYRKKNFFPVFDIDFSEWNIYNCVSYAFEPREGSVIFFPSNLEHKVEPNRSNENRYSIAFNFFPYGVIGKKYSELILE
jgi:uncharacterized protein (TIGR02466 family)